ncbi:DBR1-domain-containing protein [Mollisia scopiformis]|uniref:DBR1-domain-containing protein n=1 Tax=Mollisia scopiformis TaxID=149040 RepID=A0A194XT17_MOLSC|nr:DBR1-domain-containing protein [Mollisia scopiformis]KUJ23189.1 DBR1-domain-containing protein [Mollisia scopiformis]
MNPALQEVQGLRIAVEGCGHGTLNAIYAAVDKACEARAWDGVDLLIIGGDFQAVRNASDLTVMSCPVKYREIGDFHAYYAGTTKAPYLTIFVGGNHEASSHLWELYYGGWVAPNIYYMGAANVVRVGGVRIAGMSGIWKGYNFNKPHHERLPYSQDDIKSIYHIREIDTRKLLQLKTQVDIGISHDWPRAIERHGNEKALYRWKPDFEQESKDGTLGSVAAAHVMDRLRPPYWFAAHMHCKFPAIKTYDGAPAPKDGSFESTPATAKPETTNGGSSGVMNGTAPTHNSDEIDLDLDDDAEKPPPTKGGVASTNTDEIMLDDDDDDVVIDTESSAVPTDVRAQLPAAFARPPPPTARAQPGQPIPATIPNKVVRFLALDKCLPGRKFLQLLEVQPHLTLTAPEGSTTRQKAKFEYDPEWLAITRVFALDIVLGDKNAKPPHDPGEAHYLPRIEKELEWVNENVVKAGKLEIPENFVLTAPPFVVGSPEIVQEGPVEYDNPQMQQFCDLIGIENKFTATQEERDERMRNGPPPAEERRNGGFGRGGRGGGGRGGGRGRGRGRGRGGRGRVW